MNGILIALSIVAALGSMSPLVPPAPDPAAEIIALERQALDGLKQGNLDPCLGLLDADVSFYHVMTEQRLDGAPAVKALLEPYRGRAIYDTYEMLQPRVQAAGDTAVLTYILVQHNGQTAVRYNGTQVYQRKAGGWKIIHTHWSQTAPNAVR
jgi:ketosteroid isomerase-like protein